MDVKEILKHVDHTLLLQPSTWEEIKQICDDAMAIVFIVTLNEFSILKFI